MHNIDTPGLTECQKGIIEELQYNLQKLSFVNPIDKAEFANLTNIEKVMIHLAQTTPNDMDLGKKIRKYLYDNFFISDSFQ
jgi:hypothetical protein